MIIILIMINHSAVFYSAILRSSSKGFIAAMHYPFKNNTINDVRLKKKITFNYSTTCENT